MTAPDDDYRVRSADWLDGYRAGQREAERERHATTCATPGCMSLALIQPPYCRSHKPQETQP